MNKYVLLGVLVFIITFITILANEVAGLTVSDNINEGNIQSFNFSIDYAKDVANTWFKLVTFNLSGIPAIFNLLIFFPLNIIALYMLIDIIINVLDVVVPF